MKVVFVAILVVVLVSSTGSSPGSIIFIGSGTGRSTLVVSSAGSVYQYYRKTQTGLRKFGRVWSSLTDHTPSRLPPSC